MELRNFFTLNNTDVLFEHFDDEIVAINLKNGFYYSINKPGIPIWKMVSEKISPEAIMAAYTRIFPEESAGPKHPVLRFISDLVSEGLVIDSGKKAAKPRIPEELASKIGLGDPSPHGVPLLEKYTDQQELLLLDPIHEVSGLGWPEKKEKGPDND